MYTAAPLVCEPSTFEVEMSIKKTKLPDIDEIPAEMIKARGRVFRSEIHQLTHVIWNEEELREQWKESIILRIYKKGDRTDYSNYRDISLLPTTYRILFNIFL